MDLKSPVVSPIYIVTLSNHSISDLVPRRTWSPKIASPSTERKQYRRLIGDHFMSKQRARQENTKTSKIQKTSKLPNLLMKFFYPFSPDLSTLTPK